MTVANQLTVLRVALIPPGIGLLLLEPVPGSVLLSLLVFGIAALTDWADGYRARTHDERTEFGAFMDPLADKLLVLSYFLVLEAVGVYPLWLLLLMLAREILNDGFRNFAASQGAILAANRWAKWKTGLQMASLTLALLAWSLLRDFGVDGFHPAWIGSLARVTMGAALVCGGIGTWQFLARNLSFLR